MVNRAAKRVPGGHKVISKTSSDQWCQEGEAIRRARGGQKGAQQSSAGSNLLCECGSRVVVRAPVSRESGRHTKKTIKSQKGASWSRQCRSEQQGGCRAVPSDEEASNSQESTEQSRLGSSNEKCAEQPAER